VAVHRRGQRPTDRSGAVGENREIVTITKVRCGQRQEDDRRWLSGKIKLSPRVKSLRPQFPNPGQGNVDERNLMPNALKARAGSKPNYPGPDDEDPRSLR
jgi:hypothetical protein